MSGFCRLHASPGMPSACAGKAGDHELTLAPKNVILKKSSLTCGMPASPLNGAGLRSIAVQCLSSHSRCRCAKWRHKVLPKSCCPKSAA